MTVADHNGPQTDELRVRLERFGLYEAIMEFTEGHRTHQFRWMVPPYHVLAAAWVPRQGLKLHVSASVMNVTQMVGLFVPYLLERNIDFKVIPSVHELERLNRGLYGLTQVGKAATIYPRDTNEAYRTGMELVALLAGFRSPTVVSDLQIATDAPVYYRYGVNYAVVTDDPRDWKMVTRPDGEEENDDRSGLKPIPDWAEDPFAAVRKVKRAEPLLPQGPCRYLPTEILYRRGGGGVYGALRIDAAAQATSQVVIKVAADPGEQDLDGTTSADRLEHQKTVLQSLPDTRWTPAVVDWQRTDAGAMLVMERMAGRPLGNQLSKDGLRLDRSHVLAVLKDVVAFLKVLETHTLVHGDLTLENILFDPETSTVAFVDFEHVGHPHHIVHQGFAFARRETSAAGSSSVEHRAATEQAYGLGCLLLLLTAQDRYADFVHEYVLASAPMDFETWWAKASPEAEPEFLPLQTLAHTLMAQADQLSTADIEALLRHITTT